MAYFTPSIRNRGLGISLLLLLICVPLLGCFAAPPESWHDGSFLIQVSAVVFVLFALWCTGLVNLVRSADRGYSPSRSSLAAVIMLLAVVPLAVVGYQVLWTAAHLK